MSTQSQQSESSRIDTWCLGCCFAQDLTCKLSNIIKFTKQNVTIEVENGANRIIGRVCPCYRDKIWQQAFAGKELERLKRETEVKYDLVVLVQDLNNLTKIVELVKSQAIKPRQIIAVSRTIPLINLSRLFIEVNLGIKWRTELLHPKETEWTDIEIIDFIGNQCKNTYFICIKDTCEQLPDFVKLNELINIELRPIIAFQHKKNEIFNVVYNRHAWALTKSIMLLDKWCQNESPELYYIYD
jgi:hypothetical protein